MNVKELKAQLEPLPDDMDILVELENGGDSSVIEDFLSFPSTNREGEQIFVIHEKVASKSDTLNAAVFDDQLRLGIPAEFIEFCSENHTTPSEVLHGFIADLLCLKNYTTNPRGDHLSRNGSDESDLAEQYFQRVGYPYRAEF